MTTAQHANDDAPPYPTYEWTSTNVEEEPPSEKPLPPTTSVDEEDAIITEKRHEGAPNYYEDDHPNHPTATRPSYSEDDQPQNTEQPLTDLETPLVREVRGKKGWTRMQNMGM